MSLSLPLILGLLAQAPAPNDLGKVEGLRAMRALAESVVIETIHDSSREKVALLEGPLYRFDDAARRTFDGTVWAWGGPGRPAALFTLSSDDMPRNLPRWLGEFTSLSAGPLSATGPLRQVWAPKDAGIVTRKFPMAPAPAEGEARRLRQMKELVRRFKAFEFVEPNLDGRARPERYELRSLPQPVLRYADSKAGLIDGAMFFIVYGTNPEIALLIEARREGSSAPAWTFGLARIAGAELHVNLDDDEVWKQPRDFGPGLRSPYGVLLIPRFNAEINRPDH